MKCAACYVPLSNYPPANPASGKRFAYSEIEVNDNGRTRTLVYCEPCTNGLESAQHARVTEKPMTATSSSVVALSQRGLVPPVSSVLLSGLLDFGEGLRPPLEAALARYVLIGKSGAGKTCGETILAEEFIANGVPVVIFDVLGTMSGMRSSCDGTAAGIAIPILGGPHGDLPLYLGDAAALARVVAQGYSVIFDLSQFSRDEKCEFVAQFLPVFKACVQCVMHVIFEEAETFAPRTMRSEAHGAAYVATTVFARECRNASIGWTFSTQRPHLLAHDVIDSSNAFIAMLMTGDDATKAIGAEARTRVGAGPARQILADLGALRRGEAWLIAESGWLGDDEDESVPVKFRFRWRKTFEASYRLKVGERRITPSVRAEVDVRAFREALRWASEAEIEDVPTDVEEIHSLVDAPAPRDRIAALEARVTDLEAALRRASMHLVRSSDDVMLDAGECSRRIVMALLAQLPVEHTPRAALAEMCSVPAQSDAFQRALQGLRDAGWIEMQRGRHGGVGLTKVGLETLEPIDRLWDTIAERCPHVTEQEVA